MIIQDPAYLKHIFLLAHKAGCNDVKSMLDSKQNIIHISLADIRHRKICSRHIYAFAIGNRTPVFHPADDVCIRHFFNCHLNQAVINQNARARGNIVGQSGKGDAGNGFITFDFTGR